MIRRMVFYGPYAAEDINDISRIYGQEFTNVAAIMATLNASISTLATLGYRWPLVELTGELPIYGNVATVYTTATLTMIGDDGGWYVPGSIFGRIEFPTTTYATIYTVGNTMATLLYIEDPVLGGNTPASGGFIDTTDKYRIVREYPLIADIQYLRYT